MSAHEAAFQAWLVRLAAEGIPVPADPGLLRLAFIEGALWSSADLTRRLQEIAS